MWALSSRGGGCKALVAGTLKKMPFLRLPKGSEWAASGTIQHHNTSAAIYRHSAQFKFKILIW